MAVAPTLNVKAVDFVNMDEPTPGCTRDGLSVRLKTRYVGIAALKSGSKCSFIIYRLRFIAGFCLAPPALQTFLNGLLCKVLPQIIKKSGKRLGLRDFPC